MATQPFTAVGKSLHDLAKTMQTLPKATPGAFAYANSGVLQQAGVVMAARYITPEKHAKSDGRRTNQYTEPPGATHGPVKMSHRDNSGAAVRNARGQFINVPVERKLFIKGKFVSRTGEMLATAQELSRAAPTQLVDVVLAHGVNPKIGRSGGEITAGIYADGNGYLEITGGWKAAEVGVRSGYPAGVKGWWRALRSSQGRWATLLKKKFPDLLTVKISR